MTDWTDKHIGYLPIACPCCGRSRVEATLRTITTDTKYHCVGDQFVCAVECQKCGMDEDWDHPVANQVLTEEPLLSFVDGMPVGYKSKESYECLQSRLDCGIGAMEMYRNRTLGAEDELAIMRRAVSEAWTALGYPCAENVSAASDKLEPFVPDSEKGPQ